MQGTSQVKSAKSIAARLPQGVDALNVRQTLVNNTDCITQVPGDRWDADVWAQASVLNLYDPDRSKAPRSKIVSAHAFGQAGQDEQLKQDIAWFHGAIAGQMNLSDPDPAVTGYLVARLQSAWASLVADGDSVEDAPAQRGEQPA